MQHFVLTYRYVDDYMARRDAYRAEHLARLQKAVDDGFVLAVGVLPESLCSHCLLRKLGRRSARVCQRRSL